MNPEMFKLPENPVKETHELAVYLAGYAAGAHDDRLAAASKWLERLSDNICAQGYIGCRGGARCTSDHK